MLSVSNQELSGLLRFSKGISLDFFAYAFRLSPPGSLSLEHYRHIKQPLNIAERYLAKALAQGRQGVTFCFMARQAQARLSSVDCSPKA